MRNLLPLTFATLLALAFAACKREDGTPPSISLLAPADHSSHVASAAIPIQFQASDEGGLASVTVQLADANLGTVVASSSLSLSGTTQTRSLNLNCGDRYTPGGNYNLTLTAFDKTGNSARAAIVLQVAELPYQLYRTVFTVYPPSVGIYQLFSIDSAGFTDVGPYLGDSVADVLVENRYQRVAVALRDDGSVRGYHPEDFEADFVYQALPVQRALTCLASAGKDGYLIGYATTPYLRQLDRNGMWQNDWDAVLYPVRNAFYNQSSVLLSVHGLLDQPVKLDNYSYPGENLTSARPLSADLLYMARAGQDLIAAGPSGNLTKVFRLSLPGLVVLDSATITSPFLAADGAGNYHFVLTEDGVTRLNLSNLNQNVNFLPGTFTGLGFEPSRQQLWLGGMGQLQVYDLNANFVATHITSVGEIRHIGFHLNK